MFPAPKLFDFFFFALCITIWYEISLFFFPCSVFFNVSLQKKTIVFYLMEVNILFQNDPAAAFIESWC